MPLPTLVVGGGGGAHSSHTDEGPIIYSMQCATNIHLFPANLGGSACSSEIVQ